MDLQIVSTTLSDSNQTAVPSLIRRGLNLRPKDGLIWRLNKDLKTATIKVKPRKWGTYMCGLGAEIWKGVDVEKYIRDGRKSRKF